MWWARLLISFWKTLHLVGCNLKLCFLKWSNTMHRYCKCSSSISKRLSHCQSRLSSMPGSVPLGSSALTSETWLGHYTVWMPYICIPKILGFPWWKQCISLTPQPLQLDRNLPSGPSRRSILLQLGFQWLLVPGEADRSLSWFWHSAYESQCKSTDLHLLCTLIQLHYTMGFDWGQ